MQHRLQKIHAWSENVKADRPGVCWLIDAGLHGKCQAVHADAACAEQSRHIALLLGEDDTLPNFRMDQTCMADAQARRAPHMPRLPVSFP